MLVLHQLFFSSFDKAIITLVSKLDKDTTRKLQFNISHKKPSLPRSLQDNKETKIYAKKFKTTKINIWLWSKSRIRQIIRYVERMKSKQAKEIRKTILIQTCAIQYINCQPHVAKLKINNFKFSFSVTLATFQVLNSPMWLVAAIPDNIVIEHYTITAESCTGQH